MLSRCRSSVAQTASERGIYGTLSAPERMATMDDELVLERDARRGMYARIERFNLSQGFAELAEEWADRIAPIMRRQPGLQSLTMLSDETSGEYIFLTHWETIEQI